MGIQGKFCNIEKSALTAAILKHHGVLTKVAKEFDVNRFTIRLKIQEDQELVELLRHVRQDVSGKFVELAENTIFYALSNVHKDLNSALKAAALVIKYKGKDFDWHEMNEQLKQDITVIEVNPESVTESEQYNRNAVQVQMPTISESSMECIEVSED